MRKFTFIQIIMFYILVASCNDNNNIQPLCTSFQSHAVWASENFKTGYTIQFPSNYEGDGETLSPAHYFNKNRTDNNARFFWSHCEWASCQEYGRVPLTTLRDTIKAGAVEIFNTGGYLIRNDLTAHKIFCDSAGIAAVFYHNTQPDTDGALFIKQDDDKYYAAVMMHYDISTQQEVENILKTIQPGSISPPSNN